MTRLVSGSGLNALAQVLAFLLVLAIPVRAFAAEPLILTYHEIVDPAAALNPDFAIAPTDFIDEMKWLEQTGHHFISVDEMLAAHTGAKTLPEKSVLLTFDDGYRSAYLNAFPYLQSRRIPFVIALVGAWQEGVGAVEFAGKQAPRDAFMSWNEVRLLRASGLCDIASHSYDLHKGIVANPQGNLEPAAVSRQWMAEQGRYEPEEQYRARVADDLKRNHDLIMRETGVAPRVMVWPYGRYSEHLAATASSLGMSVGFTLDDGANTPHTPLWGLRRMLMGGRVAPADFQREVLRREHGYAPNDMPQKVVHVDLDYIYDPDPAQQERNLGHLLDRLQGLAANVVYLEAFSDLNGDGAAEAVYFPSRRMPMRADLLNRTVWQIKTRTQVRRVYAWMPLLAFNLPDTDPAAALRVIADPAAQKSGHTVTGYVRLSPFSPVARQAVREIYEDLSRSALFDGVLFHDDATLSDFEDASPDALATYQTWKLPASVAGIRASPRLLRRWTRMKVDALDDFALEMAGVMRAEQPSLLTARNLYGRVALDPRSEAWYAQSLESSLRKFDFTAIEAMPKLAGYTDDAKFYDQLVNAVRRHPDGMARAVFELQTVDWSKGSEPIPSQELAGAIRYLYGKGVRHVGYYPDQLFKNHPDWSEVRHAFALR